MPEPVGAPVQQPVGEAPIQPESTTQARASVPTQPPAEVPPAPMTEPCAVISKEPEAPRFTLPLRDQQVNDGDKAIFKVFFRGTPSPTVTWFFNSQPIKPSRDFQIHVDVKRGESSLVIVEVFPEDEGEYMCKAENTMGAAVTHCHLFVRCKYLDRIIIQITTFMPHNALIFLYIHVWKFPFLSSAILFLWSI